MDCGTPHLSLLCMGMFKLGQHVVAGASCCDKIDTLFNSPLFLGFAELSNSTNAYVHTPTPTYKWCVKLNEHGHQVSLKESLVAKTEFDALAFQTSHMVHCNVSFSLECRFPFTTRNVVQFHPGYVCPLVYTCKHPPVAANVRAAGLCYNKSNR